MNEEKDPIKLRESRIAQLTDFALDSLRHRGDPAFLETFILFVAKEAKARFKVTESTANDYGETAALNALRTLHEEGMSR